ncbi:beta-fructofuranosidase, cell wall isozyme [Parachaetomium inaequale]|uniref:Beta-fructofuranosidase, cell wall isozyme n=1 Tax=Parachaetomium inaequale TaxID=2588326 RepID=A0AAN6SP89_9PEZI|nr:beta-fructofuranosidase, cell wall isozyme [Parachaetomium inaequale]
MGWLNDPCAPGTEWGSISWVCAHSSDFVSWTAFDTPSLTPTATQDPCGVFTGCLSPETLEPGSLTVFYTSVSHLPIHHSLPYKGGAEVLHIATSLDSGRTWSRFEGDPVLPEPPAHLGVTGWRDPFVAPWPSLSVELGQPADTLYGTNWEVANFISLPGPEPSDVHDFLILNVEGRLQNSSSKDQTQFRVDHAQMWMCGRIRREDGQAVTMDYQYGSRIDHGAYYAGNSFWDPKIQKQAIIGWLIGPGPGDSIASVGLKRENDGPAAATSGEGMTAYTATTLCARPDERLAKLRSGPRILPLEDFERGATLSLPHGSVAWEKDLAFDMGASVGRVGLVIEHRPPDTEKRSRTAIFYDRQAEVLTIVRGKSTSVPGVNISDEVAPHPLFVFHHLAVGIFFDASALEVFANNRAALSTRVYPDTGRCFGITPCVERTGGEPDDRGFGALHVLEPFLPVVETVI